LEWAGEANAYICQYVLERGQAWLEENDLGGEYFDGAAVIVNRLVGSAGVRLGAWLNALAAARPAPEAVVVQSEEMSEI
jgi:hypothetical protein